MEQAICRDLLERLICQESRRLSELAGLLEREHGFLEANDVVSLENAGSERQKCVSVIFRIDEERRALCRDLGHTADLAGLEQLIRWCDPNGTLTSSWAACSAAAAKCRAANDRNGALVAARLQHVQARLGTLIQSRREPATYGPRGGYSQGPSGSVVATEA